MSAERVEMLTPPEGLRPAQLGIVLLGRVTVGHAAVTLADLADRGLLQVAEIEAGDTCDWQLDWQPPRDRTRLLPFEAAFVESLCRDADQPLLSGLTERLAPAMRRFRDGLIRDAVQHGWLRHLHHDQRTPAGDELAERIRSFRMSLRRLKASGGEEAIAGHLCYALAFGLTSRDDLPIARFAASWIRACSSLPGWQPVRAGRAGFDDPDFTRDNEWRGMGLAGANALLDHL